MNEGNVEQALQEALSQKRICNTHSHHLPDHEDRSLSLGRLIQQSYVSWVMPDKLPQGQSLARVLLDDFRCNSYASWLIRALETIYPVGRPLSEATWDEYDQAIRTAHENPDFHLRVLKEDCGYDNVILDQYLDPGSDNDHPELFRPTFRCDSFFSGYDPQKKDHDGVRAYDILEGSEDLTLSEYLAQVRQAIRRAKRQGCIALKVAIAYERDLYFRNRDRDKAARGFRNPKATQQDIRNFQDYLMDQLMHDAAELDLPVQVHTGLGQLKGSRAMGLCETIERHPEVRFDLFHASYPWCDDALALAHNHRNVYIDLCWLPLLSTSRSIRFIQEALEVTDAGRLLWGCDTWTSEESYGAVLAARHCLAKALSDMVDQKYFSLSDAETIGSRILHDNAANLFGLHSDQD